MSSQINCGYLATVQAFADEKWADSIKNAADNKADVGAAVAILENQSVNMKELTDPNKDKVVSLEWLEPDCDTTVTTCQSDCDFTGTDASPVCKEYELNLCKDVTFGVKYKHFRDRTIDRQMAIAHNFVQKMKILDNYVSQAAVTALLANVGVNQFTGGIGTVAATNTTIPHTYWNAAMFGYFAQVAVNNKFNESFIVDGNNLFQVIWQAMMEQGNGEGKGSYAKINSIKAYQDPFSVEAVAAGTTFMVKKNAMALVHKTYYPEGAANAQEFLGGQALHYSIPSYNIPGINYDVVVRQVCTDNDYIDYFKITFKGLFAINPTGCTATQTGILRFNCA